MNLYLTADRVGMLSGGGSVTAHESIALRWLDNDHNIIIGREELEKAERANPVAEPDPWKWDKLAYHLFGNQIKRAHVYAGTFTECVRKLKANGATVTYTAAAHDVDLSRREHLRMGFSYDFPHLTDPTLWARYLGGYLAADMVICPSRHSADVMRSYGCRNVTIIPHGCDLPERAVEPPTEPFVVGYLGAVGPDKGLIHLLRAWLQWNRPDAQLVLAGRDSTSSCTIKSGFPVSIYCSAVLLALTFSSIC